MTSKKQSTKRSSAKKPATKKVAKKSAAKKASTRTLELFLATLDKVTFQAVCQHHDFTGPVRADQLAATNDALGHQNATGHAVSVIQTQSK